MGEVQMWAASLRVMKCVGGYDERQHGVGGWAVGVSRDTQGWVMGCGKRIHLLSHLLPRRLLGRLPPRLRSGQASCGLCGGWVALWVGGARAEDGRVVARDERLSGGRGDQPWWRGKYISARAAGSAGWNRMAGWGGVL